MEESADAAADRNAGSKSDGSAGSERREPPIRGEWLVGISVFLAVFLEVIPLEADALNALIWSGSFLQVLLLKAAFVALILMPLAGFVRLNGWRGLTSKTVRGRIILIAVIVLISLALYCWMIWGVMIHGGLKGG